MDAGFTILCLLRCNIEVENITYLPSSCIGYTGVFGRNGLPAGIYYDHFQTVQATDSKMMPIVGSGSVSIDAITIKDVIQSEAMNPS